MNMPAQATRMQQLILTGQRLQPRSPLYNMAFRFDLEGPLDPQRLELAISRVVAANECLRLRVGQDGELVCQETVPFTLPVVEGEPGELLQQRAAAPLDLTRGCCETTLYQVDDRHHVWYVNQHHLITDGVAFAELFRQVERAYRGEVDIAAEPFSSHRAVEAESVQHAKFAAKAAFWAERCAGVGQRSTSQALHETHRHSITLNEDVTALLDAALGQPPFRSISRDLSLFAVLAATLLVLRYRLFDPAAHTLGMPMHSRTRGNPLGPVLEIGFLDMAVVEACTFAELTQRVQAEALLAMKNNAPGITTAETNKSFSWLLNLITRSFGDFADLACTTTWIHPGAGDPGHVLRVQAHDFNATGRLTLHFDLARSDFTATQRQLLPGLYQRLLRRCLREPGGDFRTVSLLDDVESKQINSARGAVCDPPDTSVIELFHAQVNRRPTAVAMIEGRERITYAELDRRASALVPSLRSLAVIPILAPRSVAAVTAMLAALKAGRPFVPLDVQHPDERINRVLDALDNPPLLATDPQNRQLRCAKTIDLKHFFEADDGSTAAGAGAHATAYIIFTSGTSGTPKGVAVGNSSFTNYITWAASTYSEGRPLDMPLYSSLAFDLTLTSIFVPLTTGGCVLVYGDDSGSSQLAILDVMADDAVDAIKLTPSHLRLALRTHKRLPGAEQRLHTLILGGEDLPRALAVDAQEAAARPLRVFNEYGPTEATVGCMIHEFDAGRDTSASVPIGRPIDHAIVDLLDHGGQPVPHGFDGELVLSGAALARGYWQQEAIAGQPYFTGDRARRLPGGDLVYLGRIGRQVKFRGARIELQEVENALQAVRGVDQAYVTISREQAAPREARCERCGISSAVPGITLTQGVCSVCQNFAAKRDQVQPYFKDLAELANQLESRIDAHSGADCLVLASGGKDSSYALCKIVELGFKPVVFTLDNGYLSSHALANVERLTSRFGLEWVRQCPDEMNAIFADSLARHSNVCNGCFKTIYTLAINFALGRGIPSIVTGLSRGQLFETRLLDMVDAEVFDQGAIDERVLRARIAYHRIEDAVSAHLDVSATRRPETFSRVEFFDFYRYCDASLTDMLTFLRDFGGWQRPPDTGRSTNCLINDVGIFVHQKERHYHNYAVPYAWDVRMGHKSRRQAVEELDDELDLARIGEILKDLKYVPVDRPDPAEQQLVAYYTTRPGAGYETAELRRVLGQILPDYAIPTAFVALDAMPLTASGKVDQAALPAPGHAGTSYRAPTSRVEWDLAAVWRDLFRLERVGINDNFFDLGGDSIAAVQVSVAASRTGWQIDPTDCFNHPTIAELGRIATRVQHSESAEREVPEVGLPANELRGLLRRLSG